MAPPPAPLDSLPQCGAAAGEYLHQRLGDTAASARGSTTCQVDARTGARLSFQELFSAAERAAWGWRARGLRPGDVIAIFSAEDFTAEFLGALFEGLTVAFVQPSWMKEELVRAVAATTPCVLVADAPRLSLARAVAGTACTTCKVLAAGEAEGLGRQDTLRGFLSAEVEGLQSHTYTPVHIPDPLQHTAFITFSSGSTGLPKALAISSHALYRRCLHPDTWKMYGCYPGFKVAVERAQSWAADVVVKLACIASGTTHVLVGRPSAADMLRIIQRYQVNTWLSMPNDLILLSELVRSLQGESPDLSSVRYVLSIGVPMSRETQRATSERLGFPVHQAYGSTEAGYFASGVVPLGSPVFGSVGRPLPWVQLKILDTETHEEITTAERVGEIRAKTPGMMKGYINDPEETRNAFDENGFFLSGDLAYKDINGHIFLVDRLKNMLKYDCLQVSPAEIEAVLLQHDGVLQACVGGRPHPRLGEVPTAFVVQSPDSSFTPQELQDYVAGRLSYAKRLRGGVFFVHQSLLSERGKLNRAEVRRKLREMPFVADDVRGDEST